jgi:ISXO2-like transposase domain
MAGTSPAKTKWVGRFAAGEIYPDRTVRRREPKAARDQVGVSRVLVLPCDKLRGIVEIDECFIGGKEANKHESQRRPGWQGGAGKAAVPRMRERGGRTKAQAVPSVDQATLEFAIYGVEAGSSIHTEENRSYRGLHYLGYKHDTINLPSANMSAMRLRPTASRQFGRC